IWGRKLEIEYLQFCRGSWRVSRCDEPVCASSCQYQLPSYSETERENQSTATECQINFAQVQKGRIFRPLVIPPGLKKFRLVTNIEQQVATGQI
ncbi:MAG: hypothetical protein MHMPM18_004407, partial [Marteilia pararefringens]